MNPSLPSIVTISSTPCTSLPQNITEKCCAHVPIQITSLLTAICFSKASCEAEQLFENGGYSEKTVLQFTTTEEISQYPPLAFVIKDAQGQSYVIGTREAPYPMIEITKSIDKDTNIYTIKVTFTRKKSLVPCII